MIELQLTDEEAETLYDILISIGGDPYHSRRKHSQSILESLQPLIGNDEYEPIFEDFIGGGYFK